MGWHELLALVGAGVGGSWCWVTVKYSKQEKGPRGGIRDPFCHPWGGGVRGNCQLKEKVKISFSV